MPATSSRLRRERLPVRKPETIPEVLGMINEMLEHSQQEANRAADTVLRRERIAQRNALTELKRRIRDGNFDPAWIYFSARD